MTSQTSDTTSEQADAGKAANLDHAELDKFSSMADEWWDPEGSSKPLHEINPLRANYIDRFAKVAEKKVLDVGCGGGLLTEALAKRGAVMTGIDMAERSLEVAKLHQLESELAINYELSTAEAFADKHAGQFDVVTCLEMLEHVPQPDSVVSACLKLVKPDGWVFFSTINRTPKAYALAVLGAEYLLRLLPRGTHDYRKFIRPSELSAMLRSASATSAQAHQEGSDAELIDLSGIRYNPFAPKGARAKIVAGDVDVNYIMAVSKRKRDAN